MAKQTRSYRKQILLFLLVFVLPCIVLVVLSLRMIGQEREIDAAWGPAVIVTERVVDTHILNLRKKIEPKPKKPQYILSVRGRGYRFEG